MERKAEEIKNKFIDGISQITGRYGLTRIAGQLAGLLFLSKDPMSLEEMTQRLEVSKSSVSTNIRLLEQLKIVRRVWNRKDRKDYYEIRNEIFKIGAAIIQKLLGEELNKIKRLVDNCEEDLTALNQSGKVKTKEEVDDVKFFKERLNLATQYRESAETFINIMNIGTKLKKKNKTDQNEENEADD